MDRRHDCGLAGKCWGWDPSQAQGHQSSQECGQVEPLFPRAKGTALWGVMVAAERPQGGMTVTRTEAVLPGLDHALPPPLDNDIQTLPTALLP